MNAQCIVIEEVDGEWWVLLQLRARTQHVAPGRLASIGGRREESDTGPDDTARRELLEESGVVPDRLREFARSKRCVWFWCRQRTRVPPTTPHEMDDARFLRRRLRFAGFDCSPRALGAPYGHLWVQARRINDVPWPLMSGVRERVAAALAEAQAEANEAAEAAEAARSTAVAKNEKRGKQ